MKKVKHSAIVAAVASLSLLKGAVNAATGPLINVNILGSTSANGPFSSSLPVTGNQTVYFEVTAQLAPIGTTQNSNTINTLTAHGNATQTGYDGVNSLSFNMGPTGPFGGTFLADALSTSPDNWAGFLGNSAGTINGNGTLTGIRPANAAGVDAGATSPTILLTGSFQVGANVGGKAAIGGTAGATSSVFKINTTPSTGLGGTSITIGANDVHHYVGYNGLVLDGGAQYWDGSASNAWDASSLNFNNGTAAFSTGNAVDFDNNAANGTTTVQHTSPIAIAAGGVAPASVAFTNSSAATYRLTDSDSTNGITGNASVAITGGGTVIFSSPNSYSGGTSITSGTLKAAAGSLLSTGNVTVGATGKLVLGDGIASGLTTLAIGNESLAAGAALVTKVDGASSTSDQLAIGSGSGNGTLTLPGSGSVTISLASDGVTLGTTAETWTIATFGAISGFTGGTITSQGVAAGSQFALDTTAFNGVSPSDFSLTVNSLGGGRDGLEAVYSGTTVAAPEPTTAVLALTGVVPMVAARRRRARGKAAKQG